MDPLTRAYIMSTSSTNVKLWQIKYLLCQKGHASLLAAGLSKILAAPLRIETLSLDVKLAHLERKKTYLETCWRNCSENMPLSQFQCLTVPYWTCSML
jgi:hypothetical protein